MSGVLERLSQYGVVPVVVIKRSEDAYPLAQALINGGLKCAEVTFRTDAAADAIKAMTDSFPDMLVGAGTVLSISQADEAVAAAIALALDMEQDGDTYAAIAAAVHLHLTQSVHDAEPGIVTIRRRETAWSNKALTFRKQR